MNYRRQIGDDGASRRRGVTGFLASAIAKLCAIPVLALSISVSLYIRTSPYPPTEALIHLVAMAGCPAAAAIGVPEARKGRLGYHVKNDPDGDGVACAVPDVLSAEPAVAESDPGVTRKAGGAKFVRP